MKYLNNMCFGLIALGAIAMNFNTATVQSYAQSGESPGTAETVIISEVPGAPNWDYPAERGPWPKRLDLSDVQMEQLISLKSEYAVNTAKQKAELKADMKKMILLMTEPKLDKDAVFALKEKIDQLKVSLSDARVNQMLGVMNVMTPKQREEMRHHMLVHALSHHHSMKSGHHKDPEHSHHTA